MKSVHNKLANITKLSHRYYALRHGQSKANIAKIISSNPSISTKEHGLTELGKDQVYKSAIQFCMEYHKRTKNNHDSAVAIYASDYTRARETARIFAHVLEEHKIPLLFHNHQQQKQDSLLMHHKERNENRYDVKDHDGVKYDTRLRERYFGQFNGQSDSHYHDVWNFDCIDPNHTKYDVESVNSVINRTTDLILDIENTLQSYCDYDNVDNDLKQCYQVILVAHGDVLQILQTAFLKVDGSTHRSLDHLETAAVRELFLGETKV